MISRFFAVLPKALPAMLLLPILFLLVVPCGGGGSSSPSVSIANAAITERDSGTTALVFTITASAAVSTGTLVHYATTNGTALSGSDYTANSGTLNFNTVSTSATITILIDADTQYELDETLMLTLSSPSNVPIGTATATGRIINDDSVSFNGYFIGSATVNSGTVLSDSVGLAYDTRLMTFSRSGASNVLYDIRSIALVSGSDYTGNVDVYSGPSGSQTKVTTTADLSLNGSQITGTMNGSGLGASTFVIAFDIANNPGATLARIEGNTSKNNAWYGDLYGYEIETTVFGA